MKFKYKIKKTFKTRADVLEEKISSYLTKNSYRITERGLGYIIFVEDEFSDRRKSRFEENLKLLKGVEYNRKKEIFCTLSLRCGA